jgi:hypothetical protein
MRRNLIAIVILGLLAAGFAFTRSGRTVLASFGLIAACSSEGNCD